MVSSVGRVESHQPHHAMGRNRLGGRRAGRGPPGADQPARRRAGRQARRRRPWRIRAGPADRHPLRRGGRFQRGSRRDRQRRPRRGGLRGGLYRGRLQRRCGDPQDHPGGRIGLDPARSDSAGRRRSGNGRDRRPDRLSGLRQPQRPHRHGALLRRPLRCEAVRPGPDHPDRQQGPHFTRLHIAGRQFGVAVDLAVPQGRRRPALLRDLWRQQHRGQRTDDQGLAGQPRRRQRVVQARGRGAPGDCRRRPQARGPRRPRRFRSALPRQERAPRRHGRRCPRRSPAPWPGPPTRPPHGPTSYATPISA